MRTLFLVVFFLLSSCDIPDVPVTKDDIENIEAKLEQCISSLELAQIYLLLLSEDLQKCIEQNTEK